MLVATNELDLKVAPERKIPFAFASRKESFESLNPAVLPTFAVPTLNLLRGKNEIQSQGEQLLDLHSGDRGEAVAQLNLFLRNADMIDVVTRAGVENISDSQLTAYLEMWRNAKAAGFENSQLNLPEYIRDETDMHDYLMAVTPVRPAEEVAVRLLAQANYAYYEAIAKMCGVVSTPELILDYAQYTNRRELAQLTPEAYQILRNSAEIALVMSEKEPEMRVQVVNSILETIRAQEKWWVLGEDGIDPLTSDLHQLLIKYEGELAVPALLDTLYRKVEQDEVYIKSMLYPAPNYSLHAETTVNPAMNQFIDLAIQTSVEATRRYISDHLQEIGMRGQVTDLIVSRPELHNITIDLGLDRRAEYFGKTFILSDLDEGESVQLREMTFGTFVALDTAGNIVGFYSMDPTRYSQEQKEIAIAKTPAEELIFLSQKQRREIPRDRLSQFIKEFPELMKEVSEFIPPGFSTAIFPLSSYYQLWEIMNNASADFRPQLKEFMKEYGSMAIFSFLTGEYGAGNIPRIVWFAMEAQKPRVYEDEDDITHIRMYESFTEKILKKYAVSSLDATLFATSITPIPELSNQVRDLILQRSKALVLAAAKLHEQRALTAEDQSYLEAAFDFQRLFLLGLSDPSSELFRSMDMSYEAVTDFFRFHDATDPDSRALFNSTMELWFGIYMAKQEKAPYQGKVEELTNQFYREYAELEKDSGVTTADPVLEKQRYITGLEHDIQEGILRKGSPEDPVTMGFVGIGNSRMEKHIIEYLKGKIEHARFVGIDIERPETIPEEVEFHKLNMKKLGEVMPGAMDEFMLVWSPYMDVIELDEMLDVAESLALASKQTLQTDGSGQPTIYLDIHFPFGEHSYEKVMKEFIAKHPDEPWGMMYKDFERAGKPPVGKLFFASDPALINFVFGLYGFEVVNMPSDPTEIDAFCKRASEDDSFIPEGPQHDPDAQAVYRTSSGLNRITYKLRRKQGDYSTESILSIKRKLKDKAKESSFS